MGVIESKPTDSEEVVRLIEENPEALKEYFEIHQDLIEKYIVENFFAEDVERWLSKIKKRSPSEVLQIRKIDFLKQSNTTKSNTSLYENPALVVRRASTFDLAIHFGNRPYDSKRDELTISFVIGKNPEEASKTKIVCKVGEKPGPKTAWGCTVVGSVASVLTVQVNVPAEAIVARYGVSLEIASRTKDGQKSSSHKGNNVIVLFNPFSEDDDVYMDSLTGRKEYVLNDEGIIYNGTSRRIHPKSWDFAQFDEGILDSVLMMLNNDSRHLRNPAKSWKKRHNPVYVSRVLSAMVNCNDDKGILLGNWSGEYTDGTSPAFWSGSAEILKQWRENNMRPVKYGQCWVFSGVLTTALRAIGIPARSVTNFSSAHDTDANVTIDSYIDADDGTKVEESSDSIWNFHVWNEGWFKRPDLPFGYDGWQVVDATPQEVSEVADPSGGRRRHMFQCGPSPVKAIKEGRIDIGFDSNFIFSEVNADKVYWFISGGKVVGNYPIKNQVGKNISTKAEGRDKRNDITREYKYREGSDEERNCFARAYGRGSQTLAHGYEAFLIKPKFEVAIVGEEDTYLGSSIVRTIKVKYIGEEKTTAWVRMLVSTKRHVGTTHAIAMRQKTSLVLKPGESTDVKLVVRSYKYMNKLVDDKVVNVRATVVDIMDGNTVVEEEEFDMDTPQLLSAKHPQTAKPYDRITFEIELKNTLNFPLTDGQFKVFFRETRKVQMVDVEEAIEPGESYKFEASSSAILGREFLTATVNFKCVEFDDLVNTFKVKIE